MNIRVVFTYLTYIMRIEAVAMVPALLIAVFEKENGCVLGFCTAIVLLLILSLVSFVFKPDKKRILAREGVMITALSWILISMFGAIPSFVSGYIPNFSNALFESVSAFTTTGATLFKDIEFLPKCLLYWRTFSQWFGGMGVLVFMLAIVSLNKNSGGSIHIIQSESPGPTTDKLMPRLKSSASMLYIIYIALTLLLVILLLLGGMSLFDSVIHALGTAGTGGFSSMNNSLGSYDSYYLQGVIAVFMFLFGINFNMYYLLIIRQGKKIIKNGEFLLYLGVVAVCTVSIAVNIYPMFGSIFDALHHSFFQVTAMISTTCYFTVDYNLWPQFSKTILLILMVTGACAGSTSGGIKLSRILVVIKACRSELQKKLHPRRVKVTKLSGKSVSDESVTTILVYLATYVAIVVVSALLISVDNLDFETTFTSVIACFNNIGPGFNSVGPLGNYSALSCFSKYVLMVDMLLGRLEIFPILLLFAPSSWKRAN